LAWCDGLVVVAVRIDQKDGISLNLVNFMTTITSVWLWGTRMIRLHREGRVPQNLMLCFLVVFDLAVTTKLKLKVD